MKKNIGILTGGGDVPPLNAVIYSAYQEALAREIELIGFFNGWRGILDEKYAPVSELLLSPNIGGTVLKSSRENLFNINDANSIITNLLDRLNIDGLIVIGGEDTLSNAFLFQDFPIVLISKTIDNDVGRYSESKIFNYFTLGYPTAVEKISKLVSLQYGLRTTAYSHERIIIIESMGMHAGWLAMSSSLGNPDFIILPEFPVDYEVILEMIHKKFLEQRHVIIVIAEGACWADGSYISADYNELDPFGHPRFRGVAELFADKIKNDLKNAFNTRNVNFVNPSYYYRVGNPNKLDLNAANKIGRDSIRLLEKGIDKPVFILTGFNEESKIQLDTFPLSDLKSIEDFHRYVPRNFYDLKKYNVNESAVEYLSKIASPLPQVQYGLRN